MSKGCSSKVYSEGFRCGVPQTFEPPLYTGVSASSSWPATHEDPPKQEGRGRTSQRNPTETLNIIMNGQKKKTKERQDIPI